MMMGAWPPVLVLRHRDTGHGFHHVGRPKERPRRELAIPTLPSLPTR